VRVIKIIGVRASAQEIRYAILERNSDGSILFLNKDTEHCLKYPVSLKNVEEKLYWVKQEFNRIFRQNGGIEKIIIKMNEYTGFENSTTRETSYVDAVILLIAAENNIPVERKIYSQIGTISKQTKEHAESRIGKTDKYWNNTMADAINCAFVEIRRQKNDL